MQGNAIVHVLVNYEKEVARLIGVEPRLLRKSEGKRGADRASINAGYEFIEWLASQIFIEKAWDDCWVWMGSKLNGYGSCSRYVDHQGSKMAHRVVFEFFRRRPIREGFVLDHHYKCGFKLCVNPEHVKEATLQQNSRHGLGMGKRRRPTTIVPHR